MSRTTVALGILGLIGAAALPASAQTVQLKIFGNNYNITTQKRAATFKNGVVIHTDDGLDGVNNYAGLYFAQGADNTQDRLWVAARIDGNSSSKGDQLYYLQGSDANGNFTPTVSNATSFFGGNVGDAQGGRDVAVMELNRTDTGAKKDRNVLALTFQDDDCLRLYDLDSMSTDSHADALFSILKNSQAPSADDCTGTNDTEDANMPSGGFPSFAFPPGTPDGHTILMAAGPDTNGDINIGAWDTTKNNAYPALTDITAQTKSAAKPFPAQDSQGNAYNANTIVKVANNADGSAEYWFLLNEPSAGGSSDTARNAIVLVRTSITAPADLSKAKPGDIKVTVLDQQDLLATADKVLFPDGTAGVVSVAVGRPMGSNGLHVLYFTDYDGNLYTATPA